MANTRSRVGKNPRAYEGVRSINPPDLIIQERDPREIINGTQPLDFNHDLGTLWLNKDDQTIWMLVDKVITAGQIKTPTWIQLAAAVSGGIQELIDNNGLSVVPDPSGAVDVQGDNAVGLTTTRTGPNTLTVTTVSGNPFLISLTGDDAVRVFGDASDQNIDLLGEDGLIVESFAPNTMTIGTQSGDEVMTSLKDNQNVQAFVDLDQAIRLTTAPLNTIRFDATVNPPNDMNLITDTGGEVQLGLKDNASAKVQPDNEGFIRLVAGSNINILGNAMNNSITVSSSGGTGGTITTIFNASGTFNKNANTKYMQVYAINGGGGGGSGGKRGDNVKSGGGGGGGASAGGFILEGPSDLFPNSVAVTIGAGGAGGAGVTSTGLGNDGTTGGPTRFGPYERLSVNPPGGGINGAGGNQTGDTPSAPAISTGVINTLTNESIAGSSGGAFQGGGPNPLQRFNSGSGGAGGGGNTVSGSGGSDFTTLASFSPVVILLAGGLAGGPAGTDGGNGMAGFGTNETFLLTGGTGGGGGAASDSTTAIAGKGGDGAWPGGAGGGGGGQQAGVTASGAGGNGADGGVLVIEYL